MRVLRERLAAFLLQPLFVELDQFGPIVGGKIGVERVALPLLVAVEQFFDAIPGPSDRSKIASGNAEALFRLA